MPEGFRGIHRELAETGKSRTFAPALPETGAEDPDRADRLHLGTPAESRATTNTPVANSGDSVFERTSSSVTSGANSTRFSPSGVISMTQRSVI
jgi:hypothetical protein